MSDTIDTPAPGPPAAAGTAVRSRGPTAFLFCHVRQHALSFLMIFASVVAAVGAAIASQYAVKNLVDVLSRNDRPLVWHAFLLLTLLIAADNMAWRVGGWIATRAFVLVTGDIRRDLFKHVTGHAPAFFVDRPAGTLAGRITATGNAAFQVLNTSAWNVLPPCLAVVGSIAVLASVDAAMAGVLVLLSGSLAAAMAWIAERGRPLHQRYATDAAAVDGELVDVMNNMPVVRAFGATLRERERFGDRVEQEMDARSQSLRFLEKLRLVHAGTTALLTAALLAYAIVLWERGRASAGDVVMVTSLGFTILHGTRDLAVALVDTVQHLARLGEALVTILQPHELRDREGARHLHQPHGSVEFRDVTYGYPDTPAPILREFSLRIEPGTRVGLVGRSGSGKSTVLALLQRLRDAEAGTILVDGQSIQDLTQDSLRGAIGVVPQEVSLFARSVMENIRYGRPDADDEAVRTAAADAGCLDFIEAMPDGFATQVGDRGIKLSGGQRQRLAIARAFLRNAPILLLDEATSALDTESEQAVQRALDRLMQGRTVIAVAHRLSTLRSFDRIVVMEGGHIVQDGSPIGLEAEAGPYRNLLTMQASASGAKAEQPAAG